MQLCPASRRQASLIDSLIDDSNAILTRSQHIVEGSMLLREPASMLSSSIPCPPHRRAACQHTAPTSALVPVKMSHDQSDPSELLAGPRAQPATINYLITHSTGQDTLSIAWKAELTGSDAHGDLDNVV